MKTPAQDALDALDRLLDRQAAARARDRARLRALQHVATVGEAGNRRLAARLARLEELLARSVEALADVELKRRRAADDAIVLQAAAVKRTGRA